MRVCIVGGSNSGKTTLFNALTKSCERTGNWHGVTIKPKEKKTKINGEFVEFIDLAGLESVSTYSLEETRSLDFLKTQNYDIIVNVIEAYNLPLSLNLTKELSAFNKPIILFINFAKEFLAQNGKVDINALEQITGLNAIFGDATNKKDIENLKNLLFSGNSTYLKSTNFDAEKFFKSADLRLSWLDKLLLTPKTAVAIYLLLIVATFYLSFGNFGLGKWISECLTLGIDYLKLNVDIMLTSLKVKPFLTGIICEGIIGGIGSVLSFIPQIAILNAFLISFEQSGIIARISFVCDGMFTKLGINGRCVFALLSGFGCTAIGAQISGGMENSRLKDKVISVLPFISCSARAPVFMYIVSISFKNFAFLVLFSAYFTSIIVSLFYLYLMNKFDKKQSFPMILLVPRLRRLTYSNTVKPLVKSLREFVRKLVTVVLLVSVTVYILSSVSTDFAFIQNDEIENSLMALIGRKTAFLFAPIGLDMWGVSSAFISGVFAKEAIISTLELMYPNGLVLTTAQGISLIVFTLFYTPCIVALDMIRAEQGIKKSVFCAIFQLLIALCLSYLTYYIIISTVVRGIMLALLAVVALCMILKLVKVKNEVVYRRQQ